MANSPLVIIIPSGLSIDRRTNPSDFKLQHQTEQMVLNRKISPTRRLLATPRTLLIMKHTAQGIVPQ
ncbi:hypothetical protein MJO29_003188 [Puccinia striiformis f. sp. tritici]|nr:hypothetical protein MJO29_003188 [Puccinia striiformis f. sp. tritici]